MKKKNRETERIENIAVCPFFAISLSQSSGDRSLFLDPTDRAREGEEQGIKREEKRLRKKHFASTSEYRTSEKWSLV